MATVFTRYKRTFMEHNTDPYGGIFVNMSATGTRSGGSGASYNVRCVMESVWVHAKYNIKLQKYYKGGWVTVRTIEGRFSEYKAVTFTGNKDSNRLMRVRFKIAGWHPAYLPTYNEANM